MSSVLEFLGSKLATGDLTKLTAIPNPKLHEFIANSIRLCRPDSVKVCDDSDADADYVRQRAITGGEEHSLNTAGHTVHFDGYNDQARDKDHTLILVEDQATWDTNLNGTDKAAALAEKDQIMSGIMEGKELIVRFFCLGPTNSEFSIPAVQITDSAYVAHSEDILYRRGYAEFMRQGADASFFKFLHSAGELTEAGTTKNVDKRRVYIDREDFTVYSMNTQYGGNTLGLKKLAMRLAIYRAVTEGWLTEHMLVMGVKGPNGRVSHFTGAFPSMCGKTSTAMIPWEEMIGDDIAYLRKRDGKIYGVNVEAGMFGIILGINPEDDPLIWDVLHSKNELIVSNILVAEDNNPYWLDMGQPIPEKGRNHSGQWFAGKKDDAGKEIPASHRNARFTVALEALQNTDVENLHNPDGVEVKGLIYGGRDSDTSVPVVQAFDWLHGIVMKGASLESETTAATLGQEGVRKFNPMSNLDFISVPIGQYIQANIDFGNDLSDPASIFAVNYFIKDKEGNYLNDKTDKGVWLKWMELRVNGDVEAIKTPTGYIPLFEDIKRLYSEVLSKELTHEHYVKMFTLRIPENMARLDRLDQIFSTRLKDTPKVVFEVLKEERKRLVEAQKVLGDYPAPERFLA